MIVHLCIDISGRHSPSSNVREYAIDIGAPLRSLGEIYDQLIINSDNSGVLQGKIIRRTEINKYGVLKLLASEKIEILTIDEIKLFEGKNYIYFKEFTNLYFSIEYFKDNPFNRLYPTTILMQSTIAETADNILLQVFKKENAEELISYLNMTAGNMKLFSKLIQLEGYTTINGAFWIDEDGYAHIANDTVIIDVNGITLNNGSKIISEYGLMTNLMYYGVSKSFGFVINGGFAPLGFSWNGMSSFKDGIEFDFKLPNNFKVEEARITLQHKPLKTYYFLDGTLEEKTVMGCSKNIKLYKSTGLDNSYLEQHVDSGNMPLFDRVNFTEVPNAFGNEGYTPPANGLSTVTSIDIKGILNLTKNNHFRIESANSVPVTNLDCWSQTGACLATLQIIGYTKFDI